MDHGTVADPTGSFDIGRINQCLEFFAFQPVNQFLIVAFVRYGMHLPGKVQALRSSIFEITKKRFDRGQADVARACAIATLAFQKIHEIQDQGGSNLFDLDAVRANSEPLGCEHNQLPPVAGIRRNRIATGVSFARQMLWQKSAEVHGKFGIAASCSPERVRRLRQFCEAVSESLPDTSTCATDWHGQGRWTEPAYAGLGLLR